MRLLSWGTLRDYAEKQRSKSNYNALISALRAWRKVVEQAKWKNFTEVKAVYRSADAVGDRVIFNICGNNYRIVVKIDYEHQSVLIKFIGTHDEYDEIDASEVSVQREKKK